MEREWSVLCGVIEHLLPRVGDHVRTLDLAYGKAVTNEVVSQLMRLGRKKYIMAKLENLERGTYAWGWKPQGTLPYV